MTTLDDAENEELPRQPAGKQAPIESPDLRDIANSGLSLVGPLQILALGPLSAGVLAIMSYSSSPWDRAPILGVNREGGGSAPISVPAALLARVPASSTATAAREGSTATKTRSFPALSISPHEPVIANPGIEFDLLQISPPALLLTLTVPAVPAPPRLLEVQ